MAAAPVGHRVVPPLFHSRGLFRYAAGGALQHLQQPTACMRLFASSPICSALLCSAGVCRCPVSTSLCAPTLPPPLPYGRGMRREREHSACSFKPKSLCRPKQRGICPIFDQRHLAATHLRCSASQKKRKKKRRKKLLYRFP